MCCCVVWTQFYFFDIISAIQIMTNWMLLCNKNIYTSFSMLPLSMMVYLLSSGVSPLTALSDNNWHWPHHSPHSTERRHGGGPGGRPGARPRCWPLPDHPDLVPDPGRSPPPLEDGGRLQPLPRQPRNPRHRPPTRHPERGRNTKHNTEIMIKYCSNIRKRLPRRR